MEEGRWAARAALAGGLALLGLGAWLLVVAKPPPDWAGFGVMVIGLVLIGSRGRALSEFQVGANGISGKLTEITTKVQQTQAEVAGLQNTIDDVKSAGDGLRKVLAEGAGKAPVAASMVAGLAATPAADPDDPQAGRWGGQNIRDGRALTARVTSVRGAPDWFNVRLEVRATSTGAPLVGEVRFHLHPTFADVAPVVAVKNGVAVLERVAYGAFTVGAEVLGDRPPTTLELDLADPALVSAPQKFRDN